MSEVHRLKYKFQVGLSSTSLYWQKDRDITIIASMDQDFIWQPVEDRKISYKVIHSIASDTF